MFVDNLKKMIVDFIKFSNEKKTFPNFKETLELNAYTMSTAQLSKLSSMILPKLSDDDYFLDTKDSLVYTYLMNENVFKIIIIFSPYRLSIYFFSFKPLNKKHF